MFFLKEKELMEARFEQTLLQSQIEVQESTFSLLSKELHDNIGQLMSTAKMLLGITERTVTNPPETLLKANETVGIAIKELRSLSKSLSREWLEQFDLLDNLTAEVSRINSANTIAIHLFHPGKILLSADKQIILFRIIQEAMQNSLRHSGAENIYIHIQRFESFLIAKVEDDGIGFNGQKTNNGIGLINIKSRSKLLGGIAQWESQTKGTTVLITIPI